MLPAEIIATKRDGRRLAQDQVRAFADGLKGGWSDAQVGAMAMAIWLKGMEVAERVALTEAMRDSGNVLSWDLPGPVVDKHSTGGVGDTVSLMLGPALAVCGAYVPMISGRGLGHTGGTLDKFDAIPGYRTQPDLETLRRVTAEVGCAIIGQTDDIAPADRTLYAIRDVTGTVESVDLITASILSKKLAAGLEGLVLDVKTGSGAFMATREAAETLAKSLVAVANGAGCKTTAVITDMDSPLADAAGNALEVQAAIAFLTGAEVNGRLWDVTTVLGGELLATAGLAADAAEGVRRIAEAFESGAAAERFGRMVSALGGPADFVENWATYLPTAPIVREVYPEAEGFVAAIDTKALGLTVVELGGGRRRPEDTVDPAVGLDWIAGPGASVDEDLPLARIHAASEACRRCGRSAPARRLHPCRCRPRTARSDRNPHRLGPRRNRPRVRCRRRRRPSGWPEPGGRARRKRLAPRVSGQGHRPIRTPIAQAPHAKMSAEPCSPVSACADGWRHRSSQSREAWATVAQGSEDRCTLRAAEPLAVARMFSAGRPGWPPPRPTSVRLSRRPTERAGGPDLAVFEPRSAQIDHRPNGAGARASGAPRGDVRGARVRGVPARHVPPPVDGPPRRSGLPFRRPARHGTAVHGALSCAPPHWRPA